MSEARKNLKWIAIGFGGLVVAAVAVLLLFIYQADARLELMLAELRTAGEPTTIADLEPEPIGPEQNANAFLRRAEPEVAAIETEVEAAEKTMSPTQQEAFDDLRSIEGIEQSLRSILAGHPGVARLLRQASLQPEFQPDANYWASQQELLDVLGPRLSSLRAAFRVLHYQAMVQLADGQREEALETCLVMFRLARQIDRLHLDVAQMVSLSLRGIAIATTSAVLTGGPLPKTAHAELEQELARQNVLETFPLFLKYGRPPFLEMFSYTDDWYGMLDWQARWLPWVMKQEACEYLDVVEVAIATPQLPNDEWHRAFDLASERLRRGGAAEMVTGSIDSEHDATLRTLAKLRALRVLNAIYAHGYDSPEFRPTAAALGLPTEVLIDPFNDKPLVVRRSAEGWLIYSVGPNLKDDGAGGIQSIDDAGVGPLLPTNAGDAGTLEKAFSDILPESP